eukprot:scaffold131145_cov21-Tisochrysis_lutea.AAC.1
MENELKAQEQACIALCCTRSPLPESCKWDGNAPAGKEGAALLGKDVFSCDTEGHLARSGCLSSLCIKAHQVHNWLPLSGFQLLHLGTGWRCSLITVEDSPGYILVWAVMDASALHELWMYVHGRMTGLKKAVLIMTMMI